MKEDIVEKNMERDIDKYYEPNISEFYVGFEYEVFEKGTPYDPNVMYLMAPETEDKWYKFKFPDPFIGYRVDKMFEVYEDRLFVKYLDRVDIEEVLKTKQLKGDDVELNFQVIKSDYEFYEFDYDLDDRILTVERWYQPKLVAAKLGEYDCYTLFHGTIKNKSELKRMLRDNLMLGV